MYVVCMEIKNQILVSFSFNAIIWGYKQHVYILYAADRVWRSLPVLYINRNGRLIEMQTV